LKNSDLLQKIAVKPSKGDRKKRNEKLMMSYCAHDWWFTSCEKCL